MQRLADRSVVFTNYWLNSTPCMPARRDLFSGRIEFPWRSWGPRESFDPDWSVKLSETNVNTCFFTDHANMFDVGSSNYHHFFDSYQFVRGHFNDHCLTAVGDHADRSGMSKRIYTETTRGMDSEEKTFVAKNMTNVATWLDQHAGDAQPFFLLVDEFDPHWPLDPPEPYRSMYLKDRSLLDKNLSPFYKSGKASDYTDEEREWLEAQAAGKITLVDRWLGTVLDRMDQYNLWENTMLILTTDHGEFIGEYGQMSKGSGFSYPLFARIPLIVHYPGSPLGGKTSGQLACAVDLNATVLDALEVEEDPRCHGQSLVPVLRGESQAEPRQDVLYGWWGKGFYWTDGRYLLCKAPEQKGPLYQYGTDLGEKFVGLKNTYFDRYAGAETGRFMPHTDRPVYRVPSDGMAYSTRNADFDALFDLAADPDCRHNLYNSASDVTEQYLRRLVAAMQWLEVPSEHYVRLGLTKFAPEA
jgi:arylsulfatase A-like enzyme